MCGSAWRSIIIFTGIQASVVVAAGAAVMWFNLSDAIEQVTRLGQGVDWIRGLQNGAQFNIYGSLGVSVLALVPILFSEEGCRKSLFEQKNAEGCCAAIQRCFQTIIGSYLVTIIELVLFLGIVWQVGITYIFSFVMGLMFISSNVCGTDGEVFFTQLVQEVENSAVNTTLTRFLGDVNVTAYCGGYEPEAFEESRYAFGAALAILIALIISFMSVGRAKECISRELKSAPARDDGMDEALTASRQTAQRSVNV